MLDSDMMCALAHLSLHFSCTNIRSKSCLGWLGVAPPETGGNWHGPHPHLVSRNQPPFDVLQSFIIFAGRRHHLAAVRRALCCIRTRWQFDGDLVRFSISIQDEGCCSLARTHTRHVYSTAANVYVPHASVCVWVYVVCFPFISHCI